MKKKLGLKSVLNHWAVLEIITSNNTYNNRVLGKIWLFFRNLKRISPPYFYPSNMSPTFTAAGSNKQRGFFGELYVLYSAL